jgi:hypothetical protein
MPIEVAVVGGSVTAELAEAFDPRMPGQQCADCTENRVLISVEFEVQERAFGRPR